MSSMASNFQECRFFPVPTGADGEIPRGFKVLASDNPRTLVFEGIFKRGHDSEDSGSGTDHDDQDQDPSVSDNESGICGTNQEEEHDPDHRLFGNGFIRVDEGEKLHEIIKQRFISGLTDLGFQSQVEAIHRNAYSSFKKQAKLQAFLIFTKAMEKKLGGDANVRYAWYGASKDEISSILSHGFGHSAKTGAYGHGIYLSPVHSPAESVASAVADETGLRHVLLCRVLLGRTEVVEKGCDRFHPSSEEFDTGVDNLECPKKYIVWSTNMNTHVLPEFVLSFRTPSTLIGCQNATVPLRKPHSPWMPFQTLISQLSKYLPANAIKLITKNHMDHKERRITRLELISLVRRVAGDKLLSAVIKSYRDKQLKASSKVSGSYSSRKCQQWSREKCACSKIDLNTLGR